MKINALSNDTTFTRKLTKKELPAYADVLSRAKNIVGQTGKSIFIMPSSCLPQNDSFNSGIGHISSDISQEYFEFLKNYLGINIIEDIPQGQIYAKNDFYGAYSSSAFALGNHQINPELLATDEFEHILTSEEVKSIALANTSPDKDTIANFHNVMDNNGMQNQVLKKAFKKFNALDKNSPLKQKFQKFVQDNQFWLNFEREQEDDMEFFKFKQFLADEHLRIGKEKLNKKGIKLFGDCQIGFSKDEVRAFPDAFTKNASIGWGLPALNYDEILDENSMAYKVLKEKIQLIAKRYDSMRLDVGWAYVKPVLHYQEQNVRISMGDMLLKNIEKWVKEVKGEDFDLSDLIYEFEADGETFQSFNTDTGKQIQPLEGRVKIYSSQYMNNGWGFNEAYLYKFSPDEFVLGVGNHDNQPLKQIAKGMSAKELGGTGFNHKTTSIPILSYALNIPEEVLADPVEFAKAKWADPMMAKNNMIFYMDVFGREQCFDLPQSYMKEHPERNYAYKVIQDYEDEYQKAIKEGFGFNPMDALEKVFVAKGYDKTNPDLYKKIVKYKKILLEPEKKSNKKLFAIIGTAIGLIGIATFLFIRNKNKNKDKDKR